ncbi:MAG: ATP-dependent 6-phosphofructokinase [Lentisphaeria bacterium]
MKKLNEQLFTNPEDFDFRIDTLGQCLVPSPVKNRNFVHDNARVLLHGNSDQVFRFLEAGKELPTLEKGGPREHIFHDPCWTRVAIVTCGGLCPGLNVVIKGLVKVLYYDYGVKNIFGIRYGYRGMIPEYGYSPMILTPDVVDAIHEQGGTILGSSRGEQDISAMCDTLQRLNINILFTVGGDGTLSGAGRIAEELMRRKQPISVIGVPKTIDNDLSFIDQTFGFETSVYASSPIITCAHTEANGAERGVGLVKLMGRDSGFVAASASLANSVVNFCLVPEVEFEFDGPNGLLQALDRRFTTGKNHAVIVVAEGAGQNLFEIGEQKKDKSGNVLKKDIGLLIKDKINEYYASKGEDVTVKYFDPSYMIRSVPAEGTDAIFCFTLAEYAVHAAMAGKTNMVIGFWHGKYTHLPIKLATMKRRQIDVEGTLWHSVLGATRQEDYFKN